MHVLDCVLHVELIAADLRLQAVDLGFGGNEFRLGRVDSRLCDVHLDLVRLAVQLD